MSAWPARLERTALACLLLAVALSLAGMVRGPEWSALAARLPLALGMAGWGVAAAQRGVLVLPRAPLLAAAAAFAGLVVLAAVNSPHATSWRSATDLLTPTLGFVMAAGLCTTPRRRRWFAGGMAVVLGLVALYGLLQAAGADWTPRTSGAGPLWISSVFYHYSHYSGFLALVVPVALGFALIGRLGVVRRVAAFLAVLLGLNLMLTLSWDVLGATAVVIVPMLAVWIVRGRRHRSGRIAVFAAILALAIVVAATGLSRWAPEERPSYLRSTSALAHHLSGRIEARLALYRVVSGMVADQPWLGSGPGTFALAYTRHRPLDPGSHEYLHRPVNYAHNDLLQVASEAGVPASLAFATFWMLVLFRPAPGASPAARAALRAGVATLLLSGLFDANLTVAPPTAVTAWMLAGVLHAPRAEPSGAYADLAQRRCAARGPKSVRRTDVTGSLEA